MRCSCPQVDTAPLKQALVAKAAAGEAALLAQLQAKTVDVAARVCARCEELSAQALAVSSGVRSVLDLKVGLWALLGGAEGNGAGECSGFPDMSCLNQRRQGRAGFWQRSK